MGMVCAETRPLVESDLIRIGMGNRFWDASMDKIPDGADYKKIVKKYIDNIVRNVEDGVGLLFHGDLRGGKTSASVIIAKSIVEHKGSAFFSRADELVRDIMERKRFDETQTVDVRTRAVDMLVIDDLGAENKFDYGKSIIERVIRHRYDHKRPIIFTTNIKATKMEEFYGEGIWTVVQSMVAGVLVSGTHFFSEEKSSLTRLVKE
jgi:DNA replication protein DnaC